MALLPRSNTAWSDEPWSGNPLSDELRWYVFDDRGMYRPGEEVHVKGFVRRIGGAQTGDVGLVGSDLSSVNYTVNDPQGNAIANSSAKVDALFERGSRENDVKKRAEIYAEIQRTMVDEVAAGWLLEMNFPTVYRTRIDNLINSALGLNDSLGRASLRS